MSPSRRDVLATFLGASFAALACKRSTGPQYDGVLLGPDHTRGHRLRDPALLASLLDPKNPNVVEKRAKVVVVGGGPSGLSSAWRLIRGGLDRVDDVRILELEDVVGGTSRGGESSVTRYPWGAHYVPVPSFEARALIRLLDELGLVQGKDEEGWPAIAEEVLCRAPEERVHFRGAWYEGLYLHVGASKADIAQLRAFKKEIAKWSAFRDGQGRRAFIIPVSRASDDAEVLSLDKITMAAWMDGKGFTSPRLRWLVDYACRDDYALSIHDASAWAGLFYFTSRLGPDGKSAELMTWSDGNGRLVRHLRDVAGARVECGVTVADVAERDGKVVVLAIDASGKPLRVVAEHAIVSTPRFVTRRIVEPLRKREEPAIDYGAWAVANFHLSGRPASVGVPFAWDNVLYESPSLGYVSATHQMGRDHGPTVWTWYYAITDAGPVAREKLLSASHRDWADVAYADLERAHLDLGKHVSRIDVFRWGHAMVRPKVGARAALIATRAHAAIGPIHFAHTDNSGVALFEEAHDHGVRAAEEVLAALSIASPTFR